MRTIALVLSLAAAAFAADLPVRQVILYKHGVGFFERAGDLAPGESGRLEFKASEMDDVLKSLTIDAQGAKIAGLRYDSAEPLAAKLANFPFQLDQAPSLAWFLGQMKGARLELKLGGETVAGAIVVARTVPSTQNLREQEQVILLMDSGDLRTFDLGAASALRFPDPKLQIQLKQYLNVLAAARSKDSRSLYIDSTDAGARRITASYMVPMPVWKSTYRLIFPAAGDPTLEGWAIVDNTTGEDWTKVQLAVVSGRPISFISKLYEPKYVARQVAGLADENAAAPVVLEGAMHAETVTVDAAAAPPPPSARPMAKTAERNLRSFAEARLDMPSSIAQTAATRELGELFEYRFATPVTVKKGESAMLPFLQQKIGARKLLIYQDSGAANPMNAAELTNSTGKTLDGGPLTVYDANAYAGEALMDTVKTGDKRLITYGIDLGTRITTAFDTSAAVIREIHAANGVLSTRSALSETTTYTIHNVDARSKTLILERPQRPGYKLLNQKPSETTRTANRFEVKLGPGSTEKFAVNEERELEESYAVTSMTPDVVVSWVRNRQLSDAGRRQLQSIADRKRSLAQLDTQAQQTDQDISTLVSDQNRIRQNIMSLNQVQGQQEQVQKYARTLSAQEAQLASLRDKQYDLRTRRTALDTEIKALIEKLEF